MVDGPDDGLWTHNGFFEAQIQIPIPNKCLRFGYKGLVFCRNNGWLVENVDKGLTLSKWVLINRPILPQTTQNLSTQIVCSSPFQWKKASLGVCSRWPWISYQWSTIVSDEWQTKENKLFYLWLIVLNSQLHQNSEPSHAMKVPRRTKPSWGNSIFELKPSWNLFKP